MNYTLDACALIALINEEPGADVVDDLLQQAQESKIILYMSVVNLIEVYYGYIDERGDVQAAELLETILAYRIKIIHTITDPVYREAARIKSHYKIPLGDSIAVATAAGLDSVLVTSDHTDLDRVQKGEPITFFFIRPPEPKKEKKKMNLQSVIAERDRAVYALAEAKRRITELEAPC